MLAYESDDGHDSLGMRKADYKGSDWARPQKDKSHAVLDNAKRGDGWAKNDFFCKMSLTQLRDHVFIKANNPFPTPPPNMTEWFTGKRLNELHSIPY
jgi:hypothetical protein